MISLNLWYPEEEKIKKKQTCILDIRRMVFDQVQKKILKEESFQKEFVKDIEGTISKKSLQERKMGEM